MKKTYIFLYAAILIALSGITTSCSAPKYSLPQFIDITNINAENFKGAKTGDLGKGSYLPLIKPDDELVITVNSTDPRATAHYNIPSVNPAVKEDLISQTSPRVQTYIVDSKGNITMPIIGELHVSGLNVEQIADLVRAKVSEEVVDPVVNVSLINFSVTVTGEVKLPGNIKVNSLRFSILDALAAAGDITQYGLRENVLVVREDTNGERKYALLDLTSSDIFESPYFYLTPNDVIYVSPNKIIQDNSKYNQNNAFKLSVISTIVSASSVIASLIIALTVK